MGKEIELKLEVSPEDHEHLKRAPLPEGFTATDPATKTLQSIYFDTEDHDLRAAGISLRVRKSGDKWVQTLKIGTGVKNGLSSAFEIEVPVAGRKIDLDAISDSKARKILQKKLRSKKLAEQFETIVQRTTKILTSPDGSRIEMAIDNGEVISGDVSMPLGECEMELSEGQSEQLFNAADAVLSNVPFRFSPHSKAERGYRLSEDTLETEWKPLRSGKSLITREDNVEDALTVILTACLEQVTHNRMVILETADPAGAHQMRVGLRRLNTALKLFKPVLPQEVILPLKTTAKDLFREIGQLRDFDVLVSDIVTPLIDEAPGDIPLEDLVIALMREGGLRREALKKSLHSGTINSFLIGLSSFLSHKDWRTEDNRQALNAPIRDFADKTLEKAFRKLKKQGKEIDSLTIPERHEMRKTAKHMRYAVEFFAPLYEKQDRKAFLTCLKDLQEIFGYLNDVTVAEGLLHMDVLNLQDQPELAQATGYVVGCHQVKSRQAWQDAREKWEHLKEAPRFWKEN